MDDQDLLFPPLPEGQVWTGPSGTSIESLVCRHCSRPYAQHTRNCLVLHYDDRDPACGCDECHKGTSPTPNAHSIDLPCWTVNSRSPRAV